MGNEFIYKLVSYFANKESGGGYLDPVEFGLLLKRANIMLFRNKLGLPEEYLPGSSVEQKVVYEVSSRLSHDLSPFREVRGGFVGSPLSVSSAGIVSLPSDYYIVTSLTHMFANSGRLEERSIKWVSDKQWEEFVSCPIDRPTLKHPIARVISQGIQVEPRSVKQLRVTYLRRPIDPVFDYYIDNTTLDVHYLQPSTNAPTSGVTYSGLFTGTAIGVPSVSVEPEWDDVNILEMANMILTMLSVNIRSAELIQYADKLKQ